MMGFERDKEWSDRYLHQIKKIVGPLLLEPAPLEMDWNEATDLKILKARDLRIACRIRRPGYSDAYPYDFTVRYSRPFGAKTELEKIMDGFGDLAFYGHANREHKIDRYFVLDLDVFRFALNLDSDGQYIRYTRKDNRDESSDFIAFDLRSFPSWILKDSSHDVPFDDLQAAA